MQGVSKEICSLIGLHEQCPPSLFKVRDVIQECRLNPDDERQGHPCLDVLSAA
jgi:hypothetical protein